MISDNIERTSRDSTTITPLSYTARGRADAPKGIVVRNCLAGRVGRSVGVTRPSQQTKPQRRNIQLDVPAGGELDNQFRRTARMNGQEPGIAHGPERVRQRRRIGQAQRHRLHFSQPQGMILGFRCGWSLILWPARYENFGLRQSQAIGKVKAALLGQVSGSIRPAWERKIGNGIIRGRETQAKRAGRAAAPGPSLPKLRRRRQV